VTKPKPSNWRISRGAPELSEALRGVVIHSARQTDPQEAPLSSRAVRGLSEPCHASRSAFPCTRHGKAQPPSVPSAESVHIEVTASTRGRTTADGGFTLQSLWSRGAARVLLACGLPSSIYAIDAAAEEAEQLGRDKRKLSRPSRR